MCRAMTWSPTVAICLGLTREVRLPWTVMTGSEALAFYTSEVTVHTWDLAIATNQEPAWDAQVLGVAYEACLRHLPGEGRAAAFELVRRSMPPERRGFKDPFADVVNVPADASLIDRLVAWAGRWP